MTDRGTTHETTASVEPVGVETRVDAPASSSPPGDEAPAMPVRLGRYVVVEEVGAGGMGRVFRAYDPRLRREVALKLLHGRGAGAENATRIEREAQAMARLGHPNLVAVFDVERDADAVFIAMEFVEGPTIGRWLGLASRGWAEILEVFVAAARGLVAAHSAGIVHRDFKPTNAIIGNDGRVRVMDFGLARGIATPVDTGDDTSGVSGRPVEALDELTRSGTLLGTPRYMSPEQHRGQAVDASADQYAFCVALFEALYDQPPFTGRDANELYRAKRRGPPAIRVNPKRAPSWIGAAVLRGLATDPRDRWPSMADLVAALERGRIHARRRRLATGIVVVALAGGATVAWKGQRHREKVASCEREGAAIDALWNGRARAALREAMVASGVPFAETTVTSVDGWFDGFAVAWRAGRTATCLDESVASDAAVRERMSWCFDERYLQFEGLLAELERADPSTLPLAAAAASALEDPAECSDPRFVARLAPPPPESHAEVRAIRAELWRASARAQVGRYSDALETSNEVYAAAAALGWPQLVATTGQKHARALRLAGEHAEAERVGTETYFMALGLGAWDVAVESASELGFLLAARRGRPAEGVAWARHAAALLEHATDRDGVRRGELLGAFAATWREAGDFAAAKDAGERSAEMLEAALGPDHPSLIPVLHNLGVVHSLVGEHAKAIELSERVLGILERTVGRDHPHYAGTLSTIAVSSLRLGDPQRAIALLEQAIAIREAAPDPENAEIGGLIINLGAVHAHLGDKVRAEREFQRALVLQEAALGPDHPDLAAILNNLASVRTGAPAIALLERALALRERGLGPDHPDVATSAANLGASLLDAGEAERAVELLARAAVIRRRVLVADHPALAETLAFLGLAYAAADRPADALPPLEEATAILGAKAEPFLAARVHFAIAKSLVATGGDRARARTHARRAREGFTADGDAASQVAEVDAWLAQP